jgi:hypothetical protein
VLECIEPDADRSGPLQNATVAATVHRKPMAIAAPVRLVTGMTVSAMPY